MGNGIGYECERCGHSFDMYLGCGMAYPSAYAEVVADVRAGTYGEEWKKAFEETEWAAVSAEPKLFWCEECGAWDVGPDLSIWTPKDLEAYKRKDRGDKKMLFYGEPQCPMERELREDFKPVKIREHACPACGKRMHACLDAGKAPRMLKCPDCEGQLKRRDDWTVMWD